MKNTLAAIALGVAIVGNASAEGPTRFRAQLQGFNAAGANVSTNATGEAQLEVIDSETAIRYRVNVAGIRNLWMAHIHVSPTPVSVTDPAGPIVYWFVPSTPPGQPAAGVNVRERLQGTLSAGLVMQDPQLVGVLAPDPAMPDSTGVAGLVKAMREGRASIVIHTHAHGDPAFPPNSAGNSPPGELRGTIVPTP